MSGNVHSNSARHLNISHELADLYFANWIDRSMMLNSGLHLLKVIWIDLRKSTANEAQVKEDMAGVHGNSSIMFAA